MATDTPAKRLSMLNFGDDIISSGLIFPDGNIEQEDRQTLLWGYAGILWGIPIIPVNIGSWSLNKGLLSKTIQISTISNSVNKNNLETTLE